MCPTLNLAYNKHEYYKDRHQSEMYLLVTNVHSAIGLEKNIL